VHVCFLAQLLAYIVLKNKKADAPEDALLFPRILNRIEHVFFSQFVFCNRAGRFVFKRVVYLEARDTMKQIAMVLTVLFVFSAMAISADLSTASSQELLATYKQLRTIPGGTEAATVNNVVLKREINVRGANCRTSACGQI
jgi:preprotein translocase subunit SecE